MNSVKLTHKLTHPLRIASSGFAQGWNLLEALFLKIRGFVNNESDTLLLVQSCPPIPNLGVESRDPDKEGHRAWPSPGQEVQRWDGGGGK